MKKVDVLLTCDETLMSNYHGKEFLGFATSAPPNWFPELLFRYLFFPKMKKVNGLPWQAPYGLRKIEAKLIDEGIAALVVDPADLEEYKARVIGIYVMDPFGWDPHQQLLLEYSKLVSLIWQNTLKNC